MIRLVISMLIGLSLSAAATLSRAEISPVGGRDLLPDQVMRSMQAYMLEKRFDGWLFSGQGSFDDLEREFLGLKGQTRHRWFIFYPAMATYKKPYLLYHKADESLFSGINFYPLTYRSRDEMLKQIVDYVFAIARKICVNYSPQMEVPELSRADGGMLEWLKDKGFTVISSGSILSFYNTRWQVSDLETHSQAAAGLDSILPQAVTFLKGKILKNSKVTDYDLVNFLKKRLKKLGLEPVEEPVVAVGEKTLEERYTPSKREAKGITIKDIVYIELSARLRKNSEAMHARLGWSLYVGEDVPEPLASDWRRIAAAADSAVAVLKFHLPNEKKILQGYQVDQAARLHLGDDPDILPRPVGFNLNPYGHLFGVRFDNYLAHDDREIMPGMGFTLEPGIYREKRALRMCANIFIDGERQVNLSAPLERELIAVLAREKAE
ncbi:MAG TPA: M24 family metallopeptidase [archaeon]|nr:M24 family metallopeptidase [archaeon]